MTKAQALHYFWSGFDLPAYEVNAVPDNATMPYITYDAAEDMIDGILPLSASLWYHDTSWDAITAKANAISYIITSVHRPIPLSQGGYLWIKRGTPFAQRMGDPSSDTIKRIYINIQAEYLTAY